MVPLPYQNHADPALSEGAKTGNRHQFLHVVTSLRGLLGLGAGVSSPYPMESAAASSPSAFIHSFSSLYAKKISQIHRLPRPSFAASSVMFSMAAPIDW